MNITVLYVGSSLLAPLKNAEREINRAHDLDLRVAAYNFGSPLSDGEWQDVDRDLSEASLVFVIHVMDGENATRLVSALEKHQPDAVIVINCMPDLMRLTRMGKLDVGKFAGWMGRYARNGKTSHKNRHQYLKLIDRLPGILKFIPTAGALTDAKHYLYIFCYFLQPTPANIQSMLLYALRQYGKDVRLRKIKLRLPQPEYLPSVAIYHPAAPALFESFEDYRKWYVKKRKLPLDPETTIGLLLMRPQVVSKTTKHYDALIHAIEDENLSVIPAIATLMDNREAVSTFFNHGSKRISQIVSLTGFSFVGGPAMNDSAAASEFLRELNIPYRSAVSLDTQTIEAWRESGTGLNPIQAGMQIAIPEIDGATEPFIYGGIPVKGHEPAPLDDRCRRFARRLKRWNNLRTASRDQLKLAITLFCFPPNKGNIGTAADLDVFPSIWDLLKRLQTDGYKIEVPATADELRDRLLGGNSDEYDVAANVTYRMTSSEYLRLCSYVRDVESDWGPAPGSINSFGGDLLIQGLNLGNVFIGVQPTFGFEGDPMRLMMARSGSPHHGFMAFYTYLTKIFNADGVIHFGTHGALEFMPGKQIGLSGECWPDRLIDELPNFYVYSVNNPSEGSIAKRRSYAELISYLTPPIENAGLYRELAGLKDLVMAYRQSTNENEREKLFESIQTLSGELHFNHGQHGS
ncbi:MAG TPA: cobaltochelatase subunit CobN [Pyrinomonadaceae bacterium]|nr:cobaltochelatase subunit CobN [Pyrinomonadaceae bacterium]